MSMKMTHHSSEAVAVINEVGHDRPPILNLVGLGELLTSSVAEAALRQRPRYDVHRAEVDLDELGRFRVSADRFCGTPSASARVGVQPEKVVSFY